MAIQYFSEAVSFELKNKATYTRWLQQVILQEGASCGAINFIFCSDDYLLEKNRTFLDHDTLTDIITFDYSTHIPGTKTLSGDIFISVDRVEENARIFGVDFLQELARVLVHGVLHLSGYTDKTRRQQKLMRSREDFYLPLLPEARRK